MLAVASGAAATPVKRPAPASRFTGEVTDALRTPTHRLTANPRTGKASADLVFADAVHAKTTVRTCVVRHDVRTCFTTVTGPAGTATVTPLRFRVGRYVVRWSVAGRVVARWRFDVV